MEQNAKIDSMQQLLENMEDAIEEFKTEHVERTGIVQEIKNAFLSRATEKTLAWYFDQISKSVQRELCHNIPHNKEKIGISSRFEEIYQTEDSIALQNSAEGLGQKLEMLGLEIINLKKGRKKGEDRIAKLEERSKEFIT